MDRRLIVPVNFPITLGTCGGRSRTVTKETRDTRAQAEREYSVMVYADVDLDEAPSSVIGDQPS
jgi:hypothetical protein